MPHAGPSHSMSPPPTAGPSRIARFRLLALSRIALWSCPAPTMSCRMSWTAEMPTTPAAPWVRRMTTACQPRSARRADQRLGSRVDRVYYAAAASPALSLLRRAAPVRALVADHRDALDLDLHPGPGEVRHGDERAPREVAVGEHLSTDLHEAITVARVLDEDRHGDEAGQRAAGAPQRLVHQREDAPGLRLEVAADVL